MLLLDFIFIPVFIFIFVLYTAVSVGGLMPLPRRYIGDEPDQDFFHSAGQSTGVSSQRCPGNLHTDVFTDSSGTYTTRISLISTTSHLLADLILRFFSYLQQYYYVSVTDLLVNWKVSPLG